MKIKILKVISVFSSIIVYIYGLINLLSFICMEFLPWEKFGGFVEMVLGLDIFTWLIFGLFAIVTWLVKLNICMKNNESACSKFQKVDVVLHILFSIISFVNMYFLFHRAF